MKKIFAVSLIAVMAASASHAAIVSKAYVDPADNTGTYVKASQDVKTNLVALDTRIKAVADAIGVLNGQAEDAGSYEHDIKTKLGDDVYASEDTVVEQIDTAASVASSALNGVVANANPGVVTNIAVDAQDETKVTMTKSLVGTSLIPDETIAYAKLDSSVRNSLGLADNSLQETNDSNEAGKYALVRQWNDGTPTYSWELIKRLGSETAGANTEEYVAQ